MRVSERTLRIQVAVVIGKVSEACCDWVGKPPLGRAETGSVAAAYLLLVTFIRSVYLVLRPCNLPIEIADAAAVRRLPPTI